MAKHSNVIYFSLSKDKLEGYQREAESMELAAKRLLLGILDDSQASAEPIPPSELEDIKTRLDGLENLLTNQSQQIYDLVTESSDLNDIKARLEAVEHGLMVLARARKSKTPTE